MDLDGSTSRRKGNTEIFSSSPPGKNFYEREARNFSYIYTHIYIYMFYYLSNMLHYIYILLIYMFYYIYITFYCLYSILYCIYSKTTRSQNAVFCGRFQISRFGRNPIIARTRPLRNLGCVGR